jgi:arsenite methyltransferase
MKMNDHDEIRKSVSDTYAKAVTKTSSGSCCSGPVSKGVAAMLAGYTSAELEALPGDAVKNSFGCGNPLAFSEVREGQTVLDLGSGAGIDIILAAKKVGPQGKAIGIDMTDEMIARAQVNIAAAGLSNAEVRKGIIESLPVDSGSVDWVISNCVINLSPEKNKVFKEIARVLKPGGRMSVSDIVANDLPEWVRKSAALYSSCIAGAISEQDYLAGLKAAGLAEVEVRERIMYDLDMLKAFTSSELSDAACCGAPVKDLKPEDLKQFVNKVYSAKFHARKPG